MAQNTTHSRHDPPLNRNAQGFEDLMGSLKSPGAVGSGPTTQQGFHASPWPFQWQQNAAHVVFPFGAANQVSPPNRTSWNENNQDDYVQFGQEEDDGLFTVDDTDILGQNSLRHTSLDGGTSSQITQQSHSQKQFPPNHIPSLSSSSPLFLPPSKFSEGGGPGSTFTPKSPMASSAATTARAAELRAKLLASKGSRSRQASPAIKANELSDAKKAQLLGVLKQQVNGDAHSQSGPQAKSTSEYKNGDAASQPQSNRMTTATTLDSLMAEAKSAADANEMETIVQQGITEEGALNGKRNQAGTHQADVVGREQRPVTNKSRSVSELSEPGEIRSSKGTPTPTEQPLLPKSAEPRKASQDGQDKEKLDRQNEVQRAYQPLKNSQAQKSTPTTSKDKHSLPAKPAQTPQRHRKPSFERRSSAYEKPSTRQEPRQEQQIERARESDGQNSEKEFRRSFASRAHSPLYDPERRSEMHKGKVSNDSDRRAASAAEYKRNLQIQQQTQQTATKNKKPVSELPKQEASANWLDRNLSIDTSRKSSLASNGPGHNKPQREGLGVNGHSNDAIMPMTLDDNIDRDDDVNDWLELTGFDDEEYRERRLKLFRKKRALDIQRAELEQEELELQESTQRTRAQSVLTVVTPSSALRRRTTSNARMPPPPLPLPLREANRDGGMKIKDTAISAGLSASQTSSPNLKRQHAESSTETSPTFAAEKRLRLDMSGPSSDERQLISPSSIKGDRASVKNENPIFENRSSRYDSWASRPRSRSTEYHRRSLSPRGMNRRNYSPPDYRVRDTYPNNYQNSKFDERTCFNCGERGHVNSHCPLPRRDGKDLPLAKPQERYVSPNYRGKNPVAKPPFGNRSPHPRPGVSNKIDNRSRMNSTG